MAQSIYDLEVKDLAGRKVKLSDYRGKVLMIVNTASACGLTPQLKGLQKLYDKYKDQGFEVLGFPSADFGGQEPLKGDAIQKFCEVNYGVGFKIFEKGKVKGSSAQPLFKFLAKETKQFFVRDNYPMWNFQKYLVDRNGKVVDYFIPWTLPKDDKIAEQIEKCLKQPVTVGLV
ncbi:MAG: glutathione peroxidase [Chitinophagales bacterium]|nr:glutathione peroxidase [Chitinophagales bacterium]